MSTHGKPTKTKNALTGLDAEIFQGFGGSLRSRFKFMNYLQKECCSDDPELTFSYIKIVGSTQCSNICPNLHSDQM